MNSSVKAFTRHLAVAAIAGVVSVASAVGQPASALELGDKITNILQILGKDVPLPEGEHTVIEVGFAKITQPDVGAQVNPADYGPIQRVVLARATESGAIGNVVEVVANTLPHPDGWGIATDCTRVDIYATLTRYKSGWDVSCLWIKPVVVDLEAPDTTHQELQGFAAASGGAAPTFWIEAGYRVSNRHDLIEVRYRFSPTDGESAATAEDAQLWDPTVIANQADRLPQVQMVAEWASMNYPSVETGLRSPLPADFSVPPPFAAAEALANYKTDREQRLAKLEALHLSGVIDSVEFSRQVAVINAELEPQIESGWTYATVAGWKAFTYRVVVTAINAGIDYIFIGTPFAAGVLVILQVVVNTTKFFFHETMWQEVFGVGPLQREFPRVMDFVVSASATVPQ